MAILIMLAGGVSIVEMPVEQYPTIAPPSIQIGASYPGASAETVANTVVEVIPPAPPPFPLGAAQAPYRLDLADMRYRNRVDSYLDVLTAQTDLYNAQLALVATRLQHLTNLVDLYRYLGGGWIEHTGDELRAPDSGLEAVSASRSG